MGRRQFGRVRQLPSGRWQARGTPPDRRAAGARDVPDEGGGRAQALAAFETDLARGRLGAPAAPRCGFVDYAEHWLEHAAAQAAHARELRRPPQAAHPPHGSAPSRSNGSPRRSSAPGTPSCAGRPTRPRPRARGPQPLLPGAAGDPHHRRRGRAPAAQPLHRQGRRPPTARRERRLPTEQEVWALCGRRPRALPRPGLAGRRHGAAERRAVRAAAVRRRPAAPPAPRPADLRRARSVAGLLRAAEVRGRSARRPCRSGRGLRCSRPTSTSTRPRRARRGSSSSARRGQPLSRHNRRWWREACRAAGLPPTTHLHDLRHAGLTLAAQSGATLKELMSLAGHSSPRAALIYQHAAEHRAVSAGRGHVRAAAPTRASAVAARLNGHAPGEGARGGHAAPQRAAEPRERRRPLTRLAGQRPCVAGGAEGTRTPDPHTASVVRYQLRHSPAAPTCRAGSPYRSRVRARRRQSRPASADQRAEAGVVPLEPPAALGLDQHGPAGVAERREPPGRGGVELEQGGDGGPGGAAVGDGEQASRRPAPRPAAR